MMPEMDGFQLCGKVKSTLTTCHIPVLLLTAKTTESEHVTGYNLGADAYIDKPFSINELTAVAYSLIRNRQLQRRRFKLSETNRIELENDSSLKEDYNWMNTLDRDFNKHLNLYINDHLSDEDFNIDSLAENLNMSRSNLHRKMKALFDTTPGEYVHVIRLKQAANMLATGEYRVGEVCMMVGFHSVAHFSRAFLKHYGMSPKTYIKTQRKNN